MARTLPPVWLRLPSRYAGIRPPTARWVLVALALLLALCLTAVATPGPPPVSKDPASAASDRADVLLYRDIIDRVRGGGNYYEVAAEAQRAMGYPMRPFVTMRLPTLAVLQATLPPIVTVVLLYAIAAATLAAWYARLAPALARPAPAFIAVILVGCGALVFARPDLSPFHEVWAGLLIALSLALWREDRWVTAVALGCCAMLIRETAALYAIVMAGCALASGRRREMLGWGAALAVLAVALACHAWAWSLVARPDDPTGPGWQALLGFGFFAKTMTLLTAIAALPEWIAAPIVGLALFGWTAWAHPAAIRALAVLSAYAVIISLFCRTDTYYWGLLAAPISLVGLVFVPDALRDLFAGMLDSRRITVTRSIR